VIKTRLQSQSPATARVAFVTHPDCFHKKFAPVLVNNQVVEPKMKGSFDALTQIVK
jgi:hypothetical protein